MKNIVFKPLLLLVILIVAFLPNQINALEIDDPCPNCGSLLLYDPFNYPTCNEGPITISIWCVACSFNDRITINPAPHNYVVAPRESKDATCSEDGIKVSYCSNVNYGVACEHRHQEIIKATGHKYEETIVKQASCSENGLKTFTCSICHDSHDEEIPKLEHDFYEETRQPTCTEDGYIKKTCSICGQEQTEVLKATGHDYPNEWLITEEAGLFTKGEKSRFCNICHNIETVTISSKYNPGLVIGGAVGSASLVAALAIVIKKKAAKKVGEKIVEEISEEVTFEPSFEEKTIVTSLKDTAFYKAMKVQKYLAIIESEYADIGETISENQPNLTIIDISELDINEVKTNIEEILKENEEAKITILVSDQQAINHKQLLDQMKGDHIIYNYGLLQSNYNVNLVKLVLPIMKPDLKSDEALENIGMVADVLNIPFVSALINGYISGREIKETIQDNEDGLGIVDKATIISDLASILGLEKISSVAGLVGDVDDIKSSLQAKIGGNEIKTTKEAAEDIIDVVSEIIEK